MDFDMHFLGSFGPSFISLYLVEMGMPDFGEINGKKVCSH